VIAWILTAISLFGNWLNCRKIRYGFIVWLFVNTGWFIFDVYNGIYGRAVLDMVQNGFCVYGLIKWS